KPQQSLKLGITSLRKLHQTFKLTESNYSLTAGIQCHALQPKTIVIEERARLEPGYGNLERDAKLGQFAN
ncbi:hypothetical protein N9F59_01605, partial [Aquiluna sp.]